ncbi:MAG: LON peptidase substrate-binding domain-containing protein [Pyrinomonadaceae bacterium]
MSELLDRVKGIKQVPLFPLPLVLLPIELLPLHIFEPRYRQMLDDIKLSNNMFGVHFFESKEEFDTRPAVGSLGCVTEVREIQEMEDGRSNLLTNGIARYRLVDYVETDAPYLIGEIEFYEDDYEDPKELLAVADTVFKLFQRIAKAAFKMSGTRGMFPEIERADPEPMSFLVAAAFNLDNEKKYELLKMTSTIKRLKTLRKLMKGAADQMEASAEVHEISRTNGHSKKKIDL